VPAVLGIATFPDLRVTGSGEGMSLRFTYVPGGLAAADTADSTTFSVGALPPEPPVAPPPAAPAPAAPEAPVPASPLGAAGAGAAAGPSELAFTGPAGSAPLVLLGAALTLAGVFVHRGSRRLAARGDA
jgi:hypothetical protein